MAYTLNPFTSNFDYYEKYRVTVDATAPSDPETGELWFDTDDSTLYIYVSGWIAIGSGTPASHTGEPMGLLLALTYSS